MLQTNSYFLQNFSFGKTDFEKSCAKTWATGFEFARNSQITLEIKLFLALDHEVLSTS